MTAAEEKRLEKQRLKLEQEEARLRAMWEDQRAGTKGFRFVFGIDEAGRGPLCGPVVAGCCILPEDAKILYLNDSKKLTEKRREALYEEIQRSALAYGIGMAGAERIDEINILQATFEAMQTALEECLQMYRSRLLEELRESGERLSMDLLDDLPSAGDSLVLVDGDKTVPGIEWRQKAVIGGDASCPSISAASILAKVTRDRILIEYDREYPQYGFAANKGYGTKQHIEAIRQYGLLPIHRRSFVKNFVS